MPLNPTRTSLDNGATLLVKQAKTTPAVAISLIGGIVNTWILLVEILR